MQRTAEVQRLQEHGCSVLCLDCPEGMLFGIDYTAWTVGPRFMGVKLVPPGLHYVYCSASTQDVGVARSGMFLFMKPQDVSVFRWDPEAEELARLTCFEEEARYADGVRSFDFDAHLGPYPLELSAQWLELTRYATHQLVAKIEPASRIIQSKRAEYDVSMLTQGSHASTKAKRADDSIGSSEGAPMELGEAAPASASCQGSAARDDGAANAHVESNLGGGSLFFSAVPRLRKRAGASAVETTRIYMDRTGQLNDMIAREYHGAELDMLGELQVAYIAFLLGQNFDGFEQWKAILELLCGCEAAVESRPDLYAELCRVFFAQLSQAPSDLFGDDLMRGNFMGNCALSLLELCDTEAATPKLRKRCGKLRELVQQKFGLSTEDLALVGDDAPQVVDPDGQDLIDLTGPSLGGMD